MSKKERKFLLTLNIKRADGNALVFYKLDGQRFEQDHTVKMKVQTPYQFILNFRPPQKINSVSLRGEQLEIVDEVLAPESSTYILKWVSNNVQVSKKNRRYTFPLIMDVQNIGTLQLTFQFKFYNADDTSHSAWGKSLHHIDYDCVYKPGNSFVEIFSQIHR